jgi:hypothetical protein
MPDLCWKAVPVLHASRVGEGVEAFRVGEVVSYSSCKQLPVATVKNIALSFRSGKEEFISSVVQKRGFCFPEIFGYETQ